MSAASSIRIQVPATTANLGPGFDALGVALSLYNVVELGGFTSDWPDHFFAEAADAFYSLAKITAVQACAHEVKVTGDVPRSRGLGSSVTVRLGLIAALNEFHQRPLDDESLFRLVTELEGHPDNAAPACFGGFVAGSPRHHHRFAVDPALRFVAVIPDFHLETEDARKILPATLPFADCVANIQNTALITAAFASGTYETMRGAFDDRLHQPSRLELIPGSAAALHAAETEGALGAFLSGAGPTLMALVTDADPERIGNVMADALISAGLHPPEICILNACNHGWQRIDGCR